MSRGNGTWPPLATIDHLTPRSKGGTDHPSNLVDACLGCNASKGGKTLEEYRIFLYSRTNPGQTIKHLLAAIAVGFIEDCSPIDLIIADIRAGNPLPKFWGEMRG